MAIAIPDAVKRAILNRIKAVAPGTSDNGLLYQSTCHLYQNDLTPERATPLDQFEEADFSGYAAGSAMTWQNSLTDPDGVSDIVGNVQQYVATGSGVTNTIYGAYIVAADGTTLLCSARFPAPIQVNAAGLGVSLVPQFALDGNTSFVILS